MSEPVKDARLCPMNPPTDLNLSNYQRYWEEIHQNTVKLIQQIKEEEKAEARHKSPRSGSDTKT